VSRRAVQSLRSAVFRRARLTIVAGVGVLAGLLIGGLTPASASVDWRGDFETANFDQWTLGVQEKDPSRAAIVTSVQGDAVRQGRHAARYEVRSGDNDVAGSGSGERTEAVLSTALTGAGEGVEQWWAWSTYFPIDFASGSGKWNFFTQFHHTGSTGQSNIEFTVADQSTLMLITNSGNPSTPTERNYILAPLARGLWYDFVFHVRWSSDPSIGFVEMYVNGSAVVRRTSLATLYAGQLVYLKQGFYRGACSCTSVVYDDGVRRADSYAAAVAEFPSGAWPSTPGEGATPVTTTSTPPPTATTTATTTTATTTAPAPTTTTSSPAPSNSGKKKTPPGRSK
jgi:hypothetical protein